ncbi:hypothetical protein [Hymenobacter sp. GOD-10R]|uniref:hypothetical protein n=1 Tax=Hymenobacter sp. GOD-10R TaxID=3093922 RepID=UPI002D78935C|nr:hypothetical protein [Hymenobacter sp. GOD-10R]WRQ26663.1 hypothetical protein SD425_16445 [Hymenobacter sp. GOD-10R]
MPRLLLFLFALVLLSGCAANRRLRQAQAAQDELRRYTNSLKTEPPVPPDTLNGYVPNPELELLDALQHKYPGKVLVRTVTRTETVTLPGKTVYVTLPVVHDTIENKVVRDSLLSELKQAALGAQENSQLKAAIARLNIQLLKELNRRGCLPDTTVNLVGFGVAVTMQVKRRPDGNYDFTLVKAQQNITVPAEITEQTNKRVVYITTKFYEHWEFWIAALLDGLLGFGFFRLLCLDYKRRVA